MSRKRWSPEWLSVTAGVLAAALAALAIGAVLPACGIWCWIGATLFVLSGTIVAKYGRVDQMPEWLSELADFRNQVGTWLQMADEAYALFQGDLVTVGDVTLPPSRDDLVRQTAWPRGVPPANKEPLATWESRESNG